MIAACLRHSGRGGDLLDELVTSAPPRILHWMRRKARLADGGRVLMPVAGTSAVLSAVRGADAQLQGLPVYGDRRSPGPRLLLTAALLRQLAGASLSEIASTLNVTEMTVRRYTQAHDLRMAGSDGAYAETAEKTARAAVRASTDVLRPA